MTKFLFQKLLELCTISQSWDWSCQIQLTQLEEIWRETKCFCPPPSNLFFGQHEKNQSCPKLAEMARKMIRNNFLIFLAHPLPTQIGDKQNVDKQNPSCPILAEMAQKVIRNNFCIPNWWQQKCWQKSGPKLAEMLRQFSPPPPSNWGREKCGQKNPSCPKIG